MKKAMMIATSLVMMAYSLLAQEPQFYRAGEFGIDSFGTVRTTDFNEHHTGIGVGVSYFITPRFGVRAQTVAESWEDTVDLFDSAAVSAIYRVPVGRSAPYVFAGSTHYVQDREWGVHVGAGVEHRFTSNFGIFGDVACDKRIDDVPPEAVAKVGLRYAF